MSNQGKQNIPSKDLPQREPLSKSRKSALLIICLLLIAPSSLLYIKPVSSETLYVGPGFYTTIQEAVDNAAAGDTIHVTPGTYFEHVIVDKSLAIEGEDPVTTIVDGTADGTVFSLGGSNINITGFTIRNAGSNYRAIESDRNATTNDHHFITNNIITTSQYAIFLTYSNYNSISGNIIEANQYGITVRNSTQNTISYNVIEANQYGIDASGSTYNTISSNIIEANQYGVRLTGSSSNTISSNTLIDNALNGISLAGSAKSNNIIGNNITDSAYSIKCESSLNNIIEGNNISEASYAVHLSLSSTGTTIRYNTLAGQIAGVYSSSDNTTVHHNTIFNSAYGIYYISCKSGSVYYNTLRKNAVGIRLYTTTGTHRVNNNKITDNDEGIELISANSHNITSNWIQENAWGIYLNIGSSNNIYRNNFLNNVLQVSIITGTANWYVSNQGNYWTDYSGADSNGNGIGDTPYKIQGSTQDDYPLIRPWNEHDVEVKSVASSANEVDPGTVVDITVVVKNKANITVSETFTVTAKYNTSVIGTQLVSNLAKGTTRNLVFSWNTAGVASGNYTISAEASVVTDELNITNNNLSDGTVKIRALSYDVTIDAYCTAESAYVSVNITMDGTPTAYNTPHAFTVTYGTHTFTVPSTDAEGHLFDQWSTGATDTTITVNSGGTYTAYYEATHDVAVLGVTAAPNTVTLGQAVEVNVTLRNNGNVIETFNVTAYYNNTAIGPAQTVTSLLPGSSTTITFIWVPTNSGNCTISATADLIPPVVDAYPSDNTYVDGNVEVNDVILIGDLNGDGTVNQADLIILVQAYGSVPSDPRWDLDGDNLITVNDIYMLGRSFGTSV